MTCFTKTWAAAGLPIKGYNRELEERSKDIGEATGILQWTSPYSYASASCWAAQVCNRPNGTWRQVTQPNKHNRTSLHTKQCFAFYWMSRTYVHSITYITLPSLSFMQSWIHTILSYYNNGRICNTNIPTFLFVYIFYYQIIGEILEICFLSPLKLFG